MALNATFPAMLGQGLSLLARALSLVYSMLFSPKRVLRVNEREPRGRRKVQEALACLLDEEVTLLGAAMGTRTLTAHPCNASWSQFPRCLLKEGTAAGLCI